MFFCLRGADISGPPHSCCSQIKPSHQGITSRYDDGESQHGWTLPLFTLSFPPFLERVAKLIPPPCSLGQGWSGTDVRTVAAFRGQSLGHTVAQQEGMEMVGVGSKYPKVPLPLSSVVPRGSTPSWKLEDKGPQVTEQRRQE